MATDALFDQYNSLIDKVKDPNLPTWIIVTPWGIGETILFFSLAHAFLQTHGHAISVLIPQAYYPIAKMYEHRLYKIVLADHGALRSMAQSGFISQDRFELNVPISACYINLGLKFSQGIQYLSRYPGRGGISDPDLLRFMLRLPWNARMERPVIPMEWQDEARKLAFQLDLTDKKTVVLFPASTTNEALPVVFWNTLVARLKSNGYKVYTNMTNGNAKNLPAVMPLDGTIPVDLPLHIGLSFISFAGRVIIGANGMQVLISTHGLLDTQLTILLTVPQDHSKENHFSQGYSYNYKNIVSQSVQYAAPELIRRAVTNEFIVPCNVSDMELKRRAVVIADLDLDDFSHFVRCESKDGTPYVDEHADWLNELTYA